MYELNLAQNITRLRHERKITQEELADFLSVTKASVSKWENAQSIPDLILLVRLAGYFDITVDELLGYEPQLTREQIRRYYAELCGEFVNQPFDEVIKKIRSLAHRYYSCYPFLLQLCVLYWNHFMLAATEKEQIQLLEEAIIWCEHILENCSDVGICGDALVLKAGLNLQLGRAAEVIDLLEPAADPSRFAMQDSALLIQAYRMSGKDEKARNYVQAKQYLDLLNLVGNAVLDLTLYKKDLERCDETVHRIRGIIELYCLEQLHPNLAAQFHYQAALIYAENGKNEETLEALRHFEICIQELLQAEKIVLHGDEYFDRLDVWIEELPLGDMAPRDGNFVSQSVQEALSHPLFENIKDNREFQRIVRRLTKGRQMRSIFGDAFR